MGNECGCTCGDDIELQSEFDTLAMRNTTEMKRERISFRHPEPPKNDAAIDDVELN